METGDQIGNERRSAQRHRRHKKGWKTRNFVGSQIMLDMVEVFDDYYNPKDFVHFGSGALYGRRDCVFGYIKT